MAASLPAKGPLALTLGDPAGIGPEITVRAWSALRGQSSLAFFIIAPPEIISQACRRAAAPAPIIIDTPKDAVEAFSRGLPVLSIDGDAPLPGQPSSRHAPTILSSIAHATTLTLFGEACAVVTNPIAKSVLYDAGFTFAGHTEYIGDLTKDTPISGPRGPVMMLTAAGLRVALLTIHEPLAKVPSLITAERLDHIARVVDIALKRDFGIEKPRIALCGLNPHAGEDGQIGTEERNILNPTAAALRGDGINISDARSADTLFHEQARAGYDAAITCYHDQGLIPVKTLDFHGGVNATLGLPIVRTSPDHGTAFDIAGKGLARPDSLIAAIKMAAQMATSRAQFAHRHVL